MGMYFEQQATVAPAPPLLQRAFARKEDAWIWLPVRILVAYQWLSAALAQFNDNDWWQTGAKLQQIWIRWLASDAHPDRPLDIYKNFINTLITSDSAGWIAKIVVGIEVVAGIAVLLGAFTGLAALAGTLLVPYFALFELPIGNPLIVVLAIMLMMSWKVSGYWGVDRYLFDDLHEPAART